MWQDMQRVWPSRLAMKIGCTFVLKYSKSRNAAAAVPGGGGGACARRKAGCWVSNAATNNSNKAMGIALYLLNSSLALLREPAPI
jgi:hypothetical protein